MRNLIGLALAVVLSNCGIPDCSKVGHVTSCSRTDAGAIECVDAGWRDAGWWLEENGDACLPSPLPGSLPNP